ncbi:MAG: hypothetical protein IPL78_18965 [Chloroflexi bacterium]|nr:hypothetical protein [Chloroflexota bacterium]
MGQRVYRGEPLAEIGKGGAALLAHLHLEVRVEPTNLVHAQPDALVLSRHGAGRHCRAAVRPARAPWQGIVVEAVGRSENNLEERPAPGVIWVIRRG